MFKPLLRKHDRQPHVDDVLPDESRGLGLSETEQAAEAQAAAVQACGDESAYCIVPLHEGAGGVDANDVLHSVHSVEVHACVESDLCPAAASLADDAVPGDTHTLRRSPSSY